MTGQDLDVPALADTFRMLGDATRLRIVLALMEGEQNVSALWRSLRKPQPTVSHHLGILRMGGFVRARRRGKEVYYSLHDFERGRCARAFAKLLDEHDGICLGPVVIAPVEV